MGSGVQMLVGNGLQIQEKLGDDKTHQKRAMIVWHIVRVWDLREINVMKS